MSIDTENQITTLTDICFTAVSEHFHVLGTTAVLHLPRELLQGLLPHLNVCQLDEIQPGLNLKGISTASEWIKVYRRLQGRTSLKTFDMVPDVKQEVMWRMFAMVINGQSLPQSVTKHSTTPDLLLTAAKSIKHFKLSFRRNSRMDLIAPVLHVLEKTVTTLSLWTAKSVLGETRRLQMCIMHRLMQHGVTRHVILHTSDHDILSKVLFEGGCLSKLDRENTWNEEEEKEEGSPAKHLKLQPYFLYRNVQTCTGCPKRVIEHLELEDCSLRSLKNLTKILPSCPRLSALTVRSKYPFQFSDVLDFTKALKKLFQRSDPSLRCLSIYSLSHPPLLGLLLHACPRLTELNMEFHNVIGEKLEEDTTGKLLLERLLVKMNQQSSAPVFLLSVLRRCPRLVSLHLEGMRLRTPFSQRELLTTLSEYNGCLTSLHLMDVNLSDCFHQILTVLRVCKLEELHLHDCRLLERHDAKQGVLLLLVQALKAVPSLRKLTLSQNRLACDVHVVAELFTGPTASSVEYLDLRLNFIQPADLLHFAEALTAHPPPHRLTLNLTYNMGVRDKEGWNAALDKLRPFCQLLSDNWDSSNMMADHISNM